MRQMPDKMSTVYYEIDNIVQGFFQKALYNKSKLGQVPENA